jgi:hypothetical protein
MEPVRSIRDGGRIGREAEVGGSFANMALTEIKYLHGTSPFANSNGAAVACARGFPAGVVDHRLDDLKQLWALFPVSRLEALY